MEALRRRAIARTWILATTAEENTKRLKRCFKAGFDLLYFVSPDEMKLVREKLLPHLRERAASLSIPYRNSSL
ncbi:MAG: hypothetical protein QXR65_00620 [Candidatus Bathyarchaeia archaeon]|nr:hypothetical protein [Candidatus Bathyarchaeota archaeon]